MFRCPARLDTIRPILRNTLDSGCIDIVVVEHVRVIGSCWGAGGNLPVTVKPGIVNPLLSAMQSLYS